MLIAWSWLLIVLQRTSAQNCSSGEECPERAPCCSEYGWCGSGQAFCLGGCEPFGSFSLDSCSPNPICQNVTTDFRQSLDRVLLNGSEYMGDVETHDWVVNAGRLEQNEDGVRLIMTEEGGGTRVSSTRYLHYGRIDFVLQASRWAGVVSAAITMSDVKDEIDLEWAGENTTHVQTNHWFLGVADYNNSQIKEVRVPGDTAGEFHKYTIDWQEEYMRWLVDDVEMRRVDKTDTEVEGVFEYPTTPARVQLSLWPGGSEDYAEGTVEWAGGSIDWGNEDYIEEGYYWYTVQSVSIQCEAVPEAVSEVQDMPTGWIYNGNMSEGTPVRRENHYTRCSLELHCGVSHFSCAYLELMRRFSGLYNKQLVLMHIMVSDECHVVLDEDRLLNSCCRSSLSPINIIMPILDTRPKDAKRRMEQPRSGSDDDETTQPPAKKRRMDSAQSAPVSVHAWLHPNAAASVMARSPPLHSSSSTFLSVSISFTAPLHVVSETALAKEARRVVRELDVPTLVGAEMLNSDDGAFQDGNGRSGKKGKERIREPDHRMWAVRTLCLKERRDGTAGEDDYQLLESYNDDGEKFGGERVMKALREGQGVDVLTVCCRWYGGEMIGPIRFQHIGVTANTSLVELKKLVILTDLRTQLAALDDEITALRETINPPASPLREVSSTESATPAGKVNKYDEISDAAKLGRLVTAREKTKQSLESKAGWAAMYQSRAEDEADQASKAPLPPVAE